MRSWRRGPVLSGNHDSLPSNCDKQIEKDGTGGVQARANSGIVLRVSLSFSS